MRDEILNDFDKFLAHNFATTELEWQKYTSSLALNFLNSFFENINYMNKQMNMFIQKKNASFSTKEKNKLDNILNIFFLVDMIDINWEKKDISVNYNKIIKSFRRMDLDEKEEVFDSIKEIDSEIQHETKNELVFSDMYEKYNYLISFVKDEKTREDFFNTNLLKKEKTTLNSIISKNSFFQPIY